MIKFEEHDGLIFKMLDKPVPLTTDAEMPCLVRLIQDDSRMGMFNRDTKPSRLSDFYLVARIVSNNIVVDEFMESDYSRFEIIGTLVKEGSAEWAFGWQICEKPKEEPQPAKEPIANCENCKHVCTNSNIDHCHMYEPKPESENIIHGHIPADMNLKYFHYVNLRSGIGWNGVETNIWSSLLPLKVAVAMIYDPHTMSWDALFIQKTSPASSPPLKW